MPHDGTGKVIPRAASCVGKVQKPHRLQVCLLFVERNQCFCQIVDKRRCADLVVDDA